MMLDLIGRLRGASLAKEVANALIHTRAKTFIRSERTMMRVARHNLLYPTGSWR
ncbi:hypothetical protein [Mesorhizobium sp. dw_380]|uniref:hypothetical protein n=1 Tax=Mesorhizobium sp. dw_380 TaxID=2812001 RepID=UPI001BDF6BAC|nr:hypothetical protein [Mesorhizobium sp. dw_380]